MLEPRERYINPYTDFGFKFLDAAEIARFTPEERWAYEESVKNFRDNKNTVDTSYTKGEINKSLEIAQRMKAKGYSIEDITDITGLTQEQIEKLY